MIKFIIVAFTLKANQFELIDPELEALAKMHPDAILIHGFMPRRLVEEKKFSTVVVDALEKHFPVQLNMFKNGKPMREEMATLAAEMQSTDMECEVHVFGEVVEGVKEEVDEYEKRDVPVHYHNLPSAPAADVHNHEAGVPSNVTLGGGDGLVTETGGATTDPVPPAPLKNTELDFGAALRLALEGKKIARDGWNGKGMYAVYMPGYPDGINVNEATSKAHGIPVGTPLKFRPYFALWTAQHDVAHWVPSGSDVLATDWMTVETTAPAL